jgi:hypothetical protein
MNLVKTRNDRDVLISTSIASSMVFIDTTAVNTVLPAIQRSLDTALTDAQWVVEIYMLFLLRSCSWAAPWATDSAGAGSLGLA